MIRNTPAHNRCFPIAIGMKNKPADGLGVEDNLQMLTDVFPAHVPDLQRWLIVVVMTLELYVGLLKIFVCV